MIPKSGIFAIGESDSALQFTASPFEVAAAEQHPAEAIDISSIVTVVDVTDLPLPAVKINGFANKFLRFFQVFVVVSPNVTEIIVGGSVRGVRFKDFKKLRFAEIELFPRGINAGK